MCGKLVMRLTGSCGTWASSPLGFAYLWTTGPLYVPLSFSIILKNVRHGNFKINEYKLNQNK